MSIFDNRVSHSTESKYLGYRCLLKHSWWDKTDCAEIVECTDVVLGDDGDLYIMFKNGFAPKEDCFFLI